MTLPNLIIGGTPQSGTTALKEYLRVHPDIYIYPTEIHFFSYEHNYKKGINWYKQYFANGEKKPIIGEKSVSYLEYRKSAQRIYDLIPNVKLIFLFRHPIERAYSDYWKRRREGMISNNFKKVIELELKKEKQKKIDGLEWDWNPISRSRYKEQIAYYKALFPKEQILILKTEDLKKNREGVINKVFDYLDIKKIIPDNINQEYNVGSKQRSEYISKIIAKCNFIRDKKTPISYLIRLIGAMNERVLIERLFRTSSNYENVKVRKINKKYPDMELAVRKKLEKVLEDEIETWNKMNYFK